MISLYEVQVLNVLQVIKESADLIDTVEDILRIKQTRNKIQDSNLMRLMNQAGREYLLQEARHLNLYLRVKYPEIENMLFDAERMLQGTNNTMTRTELPKTDEDIALEQDYYGILWGVLLKKGYVKKIEEYIKSVT